MTFRYVREYKKGMNALPKGSNPAFRIRLTKTMCEAILSQYLKGFSVKSIAAQHFTNITAIHRALKKADPSINLRIRAHNYKSEVGRTYGRLYVKAFYGIDTHPKRRAALYVCTCTCGNSLLVKGFQLRFGQTKSCGCLKRSRKKKGMTHETK